MVKMWQVLNVILLLMVLLLAGCAPKENYDTLVTQIIETEERLQSVKTSLNIAQADLKTARSEIEAFQSEIETYHNEINSLSKQIEYLSAANIEINEARTELREIKMVYPPRHFYTMQELQDWLLENSVSDRPLVSVYDNLRVENIYAKTLDLQEDALNDGYIVSTFIYYEELVNYYRVLCSAVADGTIYTWNVESDNLTDFSDWAGLSSVQ
ncbi:hypothetical protein ACFLYX_00030 [Chloroflexota bacterium]